MEHPLLNPRCMAKGYLIDMDGVVYRGSTMIPGAVEFIQQLQRIGTPFLFLTNNSERTPKDRIGLRPAPTP